MKEWYKQRAQYSHEKLLNCLRMTEPDDYRNILCLIIVILLLLQKNDIVYQQNEKYKPVATRHNTCGFTTDMI